MEERVVVDTSVVIAALISAGGGSRAVLRLCLRGRCLPLIGEKLFAEYEDVFGRAGALDRSPLSAAERGELLDAFLGACQWTPVFFLWRPNLPDEGDNHLVELAVAGGAGSIVTHDVRDLRGGELRFPQLRVETPKDFLKRWRTAHGNDDD
jgi:putative PIN family toxin of toxin-antitoxin system